jgi:PAS domain S-box-containing protein
LDRQGSVLYANPAACRGLGAEPGGLAGRRWFSLDSQLTPWAWELAWQEARRLGRWRWMASLAGQGERSLAAEVSLSVVEAGGRELGLAVAQSPPAGSQARAGRLYASLFLDHHAAMLLIDPEGGRILDANPAAAEFYGWSRQELAAMSIQQINTLPSPQVAREMQKARQGERQRFEFVHRLAHGGTREVEVFSGPVELGGRRLLVSVVHDLTPIKAAQRRLAREAELNAALAGLARDLMGSTTLEDISRRALETAKRLTASAHGFVSVVDPATGRVVSLTMTPEIWNQCAVADRGSLFEKSRGLWGLVLGGPQAVVANRPAEDPRSGGAPAGHLRIERFLGVPVMVDGQPAAQISLANSPRDYTQNDLERLERLATLYAVALKHKRAEVELKGSEERYRRVVEAAAEPIFVLQQGRVAFANQAAEGLGLGRGAELEPRAAADDRQRLQRVLAAGEAGRTPPRLSTVRLAGPAGTRWLGLAPVRVAWEGLPALLVVARDRTLEHRLEEQWRQRQKIEALGSLAGGVAHDLGGSLGVITNNLEMALEDLEPGHPARRSLERALKASDRSRGLVSRILAFRRLGGAERQRLDLRQVVGEALELVAANLPQGVQLEQELGEVPLVVEADPGQLQQVTANLGLNAVQAVAEGGGRVVVSLRRRELEPEEAWARDLEPGAYARLTVADNGPGLAPEALERAFEPFFTTKPSGQGTGLGLAIVSGVARELGGAAEARPAAGGGAEFRVLLPLARAAPGAAEPLLLVVDDQAEFLETLAEILKRLGYRVSAHTEPGQALAELQRRPADFAALVTDLVMPGLDGLETARRAVRVRPGLPVMVITGFPEELPASEAARSQVGAVIPKPPDRSRLARELARLLARGR